MKYKILNHEICPVCLSENVQEILRLNNHRYNKFKEFSINHYDGFIHNELKDVTPILDQCLDCSHLFYRYYPDSDGLNYMYSSLKKDESSCFDTFTKPSSDMISVMSKLYKLLDKPKPTLLDFGAGFGKWSLAAQKVGFDVVAYEPHNTRIPNHRKISYINNLNTIITQKFDVVWLEQVLEHVPQPRLVLSQVKNFMTEASFLHVRVPNILRPPEGKTIWDDWPYNGHSHHTMSPFQHLQGFSQKSLSALHSSLGFKNDMRFKLIISDILHFMIINIGLYLNLLSTTKRYLILE
jgi:2-polyprenyl-3-methyl-5-hydroxy-6-metoxy-1,4-benzoquinol methylase